MHFIRLCFGSLEPSDITVALQHENLEFYFLRWPRTAKRHAFRLMDALKDRPDCFCLLYPTYWCFSPPCSDGLEMKVLCKRSEGRRV